MQNTSDLSELEVGFDVPALPGMNEADIQTPCLILDLDVLEKNLRTMADYSKRNNMSLRVHAKMHKSVDVIKLQYAIGNATGICCQKVSEAEVFARAGIDDILVSNEVRDAAKIDRLARLPKYGSRILVCVDDVANVADLSAAAVRHGTQLECLVEVDCGGGRCGVATPQAALEIAQAIQQAPNLKYSGIQAYQGAAQHVRAYADREAKMDVAIKLVKDTVALLKQNGIDSDIVAGGGSGTYYFESHSDVYNELQCGSYAFMDADYARDLDQDGEFIHEFGHSLFLLSSIMSRPTETRAVCDAGLKVQSLDSGLPTIFGRTDIEYLKCSDEHGVIHDPNNTLKINEKLRLVPGHCDPTCNIHDWYVGVRNGKVEVLWPVSARGKTL